MTLIHRCFAAAAALALIAALGCKEEEVAGGDTPTTTTAKALVYTDPASGDYRLKKNATLSTATHLVLDLVGPASATGSGVTATFSADATKAAWANVATSDPAGTFVQNGEAFQLGTAPKILKGKVSGDSLQVAAAQKGTGKPASLGVPLIRVALDLKQGTSAGSISLTADALKCQVIDSAGAIAPITVSVGTLAAE